MYIGNFLSTLSHFEKHQFKFIVVMDDKFYCEDDGTTTYAKFKGLKDEQEVSDWVKDHMNGHHSRDKYKIYRVDPVEISTEIKVSLK